MKTLAKIIVVMGFLPMLAGCGRTYHVNNVEISPNRELEKDFLEEYGIGSFSGDITYKAKKEIALQEIRRCMFDCDDDYCPDEDEYETVTFFNIDSIGDKQNYSITSHGKGGFKLEVKASVCGEDTYFKRYLYKKITFIHPLSMPHDSIICSNVKYIGENYGWELNEYASRPCTGTIKVYRVDGDETYLSKEMVEASEEKTVWKEYYPNGNVKSIKTITANPQEMDEYGFSSEPFVTTIEYHFEDGTKDQIFNGGKYAVFLTDRRYHMANSIVHLILYPSEDNISRGKAYFVGGDFELSDVFEVANYSYKIDNNRIHLSNGEKKQLFVYGYSRPNKAKRYKVSNTSANIRYDYLGKYPTFILNNFLDGNNQCKCFLSASKYDDAWILSLPKRFRRQR